MQILFHTDTYALPHRVSIRRGTEVPTDEYQGLYRDGTWTFVLPDDFAGSYVLVLDGMSASTGFDAAVRDIAEGDVKFERPPLLPDRGTLQATWFPVNTAQDPWDVIVVGGGMAGSTLVFALAFGHNHLKVLGIEAGPLLLPTHAGNLPRRLWPASSGQASTLWGLYDDFGVQPYQAPRQWQGRQIFALGGRSLMWGGLTPRLTTQDRKSWPQPVVDELTHSWYAAAEDLMCVGSPNPSGAETRTATMLMQLPSLAGRTVRPAPVAVQREKKSSWEISSGMFSSTDLILDARLRVPSGRDAGTENWAPFVHLSELVTHIEKQADGTWAVHTVSVSDGQLRPPYHARKVVLAAGTIETTRIALASGLGGALVGKGFTEHDMWWVHFQLPESSPYYTTKHSIKLLSEPADDTAADWNLQVEVNCDLNEARHTPSQLRQPVMAVAPGMVAGQLVFLCRTPLREDQRVEAIPSSRWPGFNMSDDTSLPAISLVLAEDDDAPAPMQAVADSVLQALQAQALPNSDLQLHRAGRGFVAHEVGTMRMGTDPTSSVVGPDHQVHGADGLYVCDNSVFPLSPAANPSLTLCALALRLAAQLDSSP
jgi:choline dehydrogenase-like flavoprotein